MVLLDGGCEAVMCLFFGDILLGSNLLINGDDCCICRGFCGEGF